MEVKEALLTRRSVRKFTEEKVSEEEISKLLHAGMSGPSAVNKTPWEFYAVTSEDKLYDLRSATRFTNYKAPLAIIVCGDMGRTLPLGLGEYWIHDCSAASENILLRAVDLGLSGVWCGVYPVKASVEKVQKMLNLPKKHIPLNIIYIGHPDQFPEARDQYNEKYVHYIK